MSHLRAGKVFFKKKQQQQNTSIKTDKFVHVKIIFPKTKDATNLKNM